MSHPGEIFSIEELRELSLVQLQRVCAYLGVEFSMYDKRPKIIKAIMDFQSPKEEIYWDGNPDWKPGVQRSARVQRLYELNVLKKKL